MSRRRGGFTLVEVMIVIAIIGIMAGVAVPSLLGSLPGLRVSGAARQVLSDIRLARTLAIDHGANAHMDFDGSGNYALWIDRNGNGTEDAGERQKDVDLDGADYGYAGITYGTNHSGGDAIGLGVADILIFRPNGSASRSGSVYLMPQSDAGTRDDRNRRVRVVGPTGNAQVQSWDGSAWI